jgi:hypothetical protein
VGRKGIQLPEEPYGHFAAVIEAHYSAVSRKSMYIRYYRPIASRRIQVSAGKKARLRD